MIELPKTVLEPEELNPKKLIIYGPPKVGKTTLLSKLKNALILDLEEGAIYIKALRVRVVGLVEKKKESVEDRDARHKRKEYYLNEILPILTATKSYDYVIIDTVTKLEEWCEPEATLAYMRSPIGKRFNRYTEEEAILHKVQEGKVKPKAMWASVLTLPNGAGYKWLREVYTYYIEAFYNTAKYVILVGHLKDNFLTSKEGKEVSHKDLDLTGKLKGITCQKADAIGYLYRIDERMYLNFGTSEEVTCGSRVDHLKGQNILIGQSNADGELQTYWEKVYLNT